VEGIFRKVPVVPGTAYRVSYDAAPGAGECFTPFVFIVQLQPLRKDTPA
jgi:hypothetical protein